VLEVGGEGADEVVTRRLVVVDGAEDVAEPVELQAAAGGWSQARERIRVRARGSRVVAELGKLGPVRLWDVAVRVPSVLEREDAEGSEELVQPRAVVRPARVAPALEREGRNAEGNVDGALLPLGVGEHAADDGRALKEVQGDLARVLVLEV